MSKIISIGLTVIFFLIFLSVPFMFTVSGQNNWWDSSFSYRKLLNVSNSINEYQMKIKVYKNDGYDNPSATPIATIDTEGNCKIDFGDIRFVDIYNNELNYWMENKVDSEYAIFWILTPSNFTDFNQLYMYYGNSDATYQGNGTTVFERFTDKDNQQNWDFQGYNHEVNDDSIYIYGSLETDKAIWDPFDYSSSYYAFEWCTKAKHSAMWTVLQNPTSYGMGWRCYSSFPDVIMPRINGSHEILYDGTTETDYYIWTCNFKRSEKRVDYYLYDIGRNNILGELLNKGLISADLDPIFARLLIWDGSTTAKPLDLWIRWAFIRKWSLSPPIWNNFGEEESLLKIKVSDPYPPNGATGIELQPTLRITVNHTEGQAMNITWKWNNSGTWEIIGVNNSVYNGTYSQFFSDCTQEGTTYVWSVNVTDGNEWNNQSYSFKTYGDEIFYVEDRETSNGSANDRAKSVVYDSYKNCVYVFYFDYSDISEYPHLCCRRLWLSNNTWDDKFQFDRSNYPVGSTYDDYYECHIAVNAILDKYDHIWLVYGGHTNSTYPFLSVRSVYPITSIDFNYKNSANWESPNVVTSIYDSAYQRIGTSWNNTYLVFLREGAESMTLYWSFNNGTTWNSRDITDEAYGCYDFVYDPDSGEDLLLMSFGKAKTADSSWPQTWNMHFFWTTINHTIAGTGAYTSFNTTDDPPYYSFPVQHDDIIPEDDFTSVRKYCQRYYSIGYNYKNDMIFMGFSNCSEATGNSNGEAWFVNKTLGTSESWTHTLLLNATVTGDTRKGCHDTFLWKDKIVMTTYYLTEDGKRKVRWASSSTPTIPESWEWKNVTLSSYDNCEQNFIIDAGNKLIIQSGINIHPRSEDNPDVTTGSTMDVLMTKPVFENIPPQLLSPSCTPTEGIADYTIFYFNITWKDEDGDTPQDGYLKVNISKTGWYINNSLSYVSGDNTTGALYSYNCKLTAGSYTHQFHAHDGTNYNSTSIYSEPTVEAQSLSFTITTSDPSGQLNFTAEVTPGSGYTTSWNRSASYQTDVLPAINLTNTGNIPLNFSWWLENALPTYLQLKYNTTSTPPDHNVNVITTTSEQIATNVPVNGVVSFWLWMDFTDAPAGTGDENLVIESTPGE